MEYSYRFKHSVNEFFGYRDVRFPPSSDIRYESNNIFNRYLHFEYNPINIGDKFEIPSAYIRDVAKIFNSGIVYDRLIINIPIYENCDDAKTSFDAVLYNMSRNECVKSIVKGHVYYGGGGLILDGEFKPLLICTNLCEKNYKSNTFILRYIVRVSPRVFERRDRTIERGIINRLLPYVTNNAVRYLSVPCKVIIDDDIEDLVVRPVKPNPDNLDFNTVLIDNIDDIINQWDDNR